MNWLYVSSEEEKLNEVSYNIVASIIKMAKGHNSNYNKYASEGQINEVLTILTNVLEISEYPYGFAVNWFERQR